MSDSILDLGQGRFGLLQAAQTPPAVMFVLLNAGAVHRQGPFRLYVHLARRLAALGFSCVRFDQPGIGDSLQAAERPLRFKCRQGHMSAASGSPGAAAAATSPVAVTVEAAAVGLQLGQDRLSMPLALPAIRVQGVLGLRGTRASSAQWHGDGRVQPLALIAA
jgi:hypothetical protein